MFYFLVVFEFFEMIVLNIKESGFDKIDGWKCLMIEKLFGYDFVFVCELNDKFSCMFEEDEIYCIDYYLGKLMI